jgi:hypothetical protein
MRNMTPQDIELLCKPFDRKDHEFTRGFVYITESAITARLDAVDPLWSFQLQQVSVRGRQAVAHARLSVNGVTRENIGMQSIEFVGTTDKEAGEAEKGAATDALKRCARLFGIGRYLLDAPKEGADFDRWLNTLTGKPTTNGNGKKPPIPFDSITAKLPDPSGTQWTQDEAVAWAKRNARDDFDANAIKRALGITERWGEWTGDAASASKRLTAWMDAQHN